MAVVKVAKFFANVMKVSTFADHALCEQGAVITKKIFGLKTHCRLDVTLQLNHGKAKYLSYPLHVEVVLFCELKKINT